jgi:hypothetical protein
MLPTVADISTRYTRNTGHVNRWCKRHNATIGFPKLAAHIKLHVKALHQMFGPNGNPTSNNRFKLADLLLVAFESWATLTNPSGKIGSLIRGLAGGINQSKTLEFRERQIAA